MITAVGALLAGGATAWIGPSILPLATRPLAAPAIRRPAQMQLQFDPMVEMASTCLQASAVWLATYCLARGANAVLGHTSAHTTNEKPSDQLVYQTEEETWYLGWEETYALSWEVEEDYSPQPDASALSVIALEDEVEADGGTLALPAKSNSNPQLGHVRELKAAVAEAVMRDEPEEAARLRAELERCVALCESLERRFRAAA